MSLYGELAAPVNSSQSSATASVLVPNLTVAKQPPRPSLHFKPVVRPRQAIPKVTSVASALPKIVGQPQIVSVHSLSVSTVPGERQGEPDPPKELIDALATSTSTQTQGHHSRPETINVVSSSSTLSLPATASIPALDWDLLRAKAEIDDFYDPTKPNRYSEYLDWKSRARDTTAYHSRGRSHSDYLSEASQSSSRDDRHNEKCYHHEHPRESGRERDAANDIEYRHRSTRFESESSRYRHEESREESRYRSSRNDRYSSSRDDHSKHHHHDQSRYSQQNDVAESFLRVNSGRTRMREGPA